MLKLTKTGIGLLTKQYRSVLRKCLLLDFKLFTIAILIIGIAEKSIANYVVDIKTNEEWLDRYFKVSVVAKNEQEAVEIAKSLVKNGWKLDSIDSSSQNRIQNIYMYGTASGDIMGALGILDIELINNAIDETTNITVTPTTETYIRNEDIIKHAISNTYTKYEIQNIQSLNYYYTFRVDERTEVIEFAKELRSNKKEMSSLDFMPIKSSSDLRINLIKAEDPLTFSVKTRDDSLGLMEVCHA